MYFSVLGLYLFANFKSRTKMPKYCSLLALLFLVSSCATVYIPNGIHTPFHKEKGELKAGVSSGFNQIDGFVSYSPLKNVSVMFNCVSNYKFNVDTVGFKTYHRFAFDIAPGYFKKIDENWVFEVFAGYGQGDFSTPNQSIQKLSAVYLGDLKGNYERFFVQSAIGIQTGSFSFSYAMRFSEINYRRIVDELNVNIFNGSMHFFDTSIRMGIGSESFRIYAEGGLSLPLREHAVHKNFASQPFILQFGVNFNIFKLFESVKENKSPFNPRL
jgi:hypothetical protein